MLSQISSDDSGGSGKVKPPKIPSLKTKMQQVSLGVTPSESMMGASTTVNNLSNSNTKVSS